MGKRLQIHHPVVLSQSNQLGTAQTSIVAEGYRCHVKVDKVVMVSWQDEKRLVPTKIMQMDGMCFLIF